MVRYDSAVEIVTADALREIPVRIVTEGWRVTSARLGGSYARFPSRFVPVADDAMGVLYLADSAATALAEYLGGLPVVSMSAVSDRVHMLVVLDHAFRLADLSSSKTLYKIGLTVDTIMGPAYTTSQDLASELMAAGFDGICYRSRQSTDGLLYALFGHVGLVLNDQAKLYERGLTIDDLAPFSVSVSAATGIGRHRPWVVIPPPVVFVSYSWDSKAHQEWVRRVLVDGLRARGVEAIMDIYGLEYGDKSDQFMEDLFTRCDHVLVVCTPNYADRAKNDLGGVGYEKALIKQRLIAVGPGFRLVPALRVGDGTAVPAFLGTRLYADMRDDQANGDVLDVLAALFYGQQLLRARQYSRRPIGS